GQGFALTPPLFAEEARTLAGSTLVPFPGARRRRAQDAA
ncbi:MAG: hypothetical protein QOJ53_2275, partial [Sphingomonadales bacterium]|nr:hypothetical protein [Sphingomonadales bacterium]